MVVALALSTPEARGDDAGFRAPEGFEVSLFAGDDLAHDIYSLTMDSHGRVVVAGRGYVKTLLDHDGDGEADESRLFSDRPRGGARGLYFDGDDLIYSGDRGLHRLADRDGDGRADGDDVRLFPSENDGEHAANGVVKGPDGWLYWIAGNDAGIDHRHAQGLRSALRDVSCGALVRVSPDGTSSEVLADGYRNPYDLDFDASGAILTYDADGERDHHLPWYSPTRVFDITIGGHHGWVLKGWQHAWNRAAYWIDVSERLVEAGRGSPTGVIVYRHDRFPERYRDGLFIACWSLGRVYFVPRERTGSSSTGGLEIFLETKGDIGFAPTDLAVGPQGDLFISIGGRGTRGSVFRVRYSNSGSSRRESPSPLARVLEAPQPLSSWSRRSWVPAAKALGRDAFVSAALDASLSSAARVRAIEILVELFGGIAPQDARTLLGSSAPDVAARAMWALSRAEDGPEARSILAAATRHDDARVRRAAWEAIITLPSPWSPEAATPDFLAAFGGDDERVRRLAIIAARSKARDAFLRAVPDAKTVESVRARIACLFASFPAASLRAPLIAAKPANHETLERFLDAAREAFVEARDSRDRLDALRLLEIGLGDVALRQDQPRTSDGFSAAWATTIDPGLRASIAESLAGLVPFGETTLDREASRTIAMLEIESARAVEKISRLLSRTSAVEDDVHHLLALARIGGTRSQDATARISTALLDLHRKMREDAKEPSRFWPVRVAYAFDALCERDPRLAPALIQAPGLELAEHAIFIESLRGGMRLEGIRALVTKAGSPDAHSSFASSTGWVALAGELPAVDWRPALRACASEPALVDAIAAIVAREPEEEDRPLLIEALGSARPETVIAAARALATLEGEGGPEEARAALVALRAAVSVRDRDAVREALLSLIVKLVGSELPEPGAPPQEMLAELSRRSLARWPDEVFALDDFASLDVESWLARLETIDESKGVRDRGAALFRLRGCYSCHAGSSRLGPDLAGIASRLSRRDVFTAIVDPNREISPAYITKEIVTRRGDAYAGILIYDSPSVTLLQVGPETTVRIGDGEIATMRDSARSFMPEGLLAGLEDGEIADLWAYLRTLGAR